MTGRRHPTAVLLAAALALAIASGGCSLVGGGGGYQITAEFDRTVGLYEKSVVKVMGVDAGIVDSIEIDGEIVRVEMTINDGVPLPADVNATIAPLTLIGERNVVLSPPWHPGDERLADGAVLDTEHTFIPIEPDEVLQSITDLAKAIDPEAVSKLVTSGAEAIDGRGATFNRALEEVSGLTKTLADQDEQLLEAARNINVIATALNTRSDQLGHLVDSLSEASSVLAAERDSLGRFLTSVVTLSDAGGSLLDAYEGTLPGDVAILGDLALVLENNLGSLTQTVSLFPRISRDLVEAYDPARGGLVLNVSLSPLSSIALRPLFDLLGLPVPCIPVVGDITCP